MLGAPVALGTAGVASASTAASQSVPPPGTNPTPPGGFSAIVTCQAVSPAGETIGPVGVAGAVVAVHIPAGAFPANVQICLMAPDLGVIPPTPGFTVVAGVGVEVTLNGAPYPGTFLMPVTVTITSPRITASSQVVVWNGSSFVNDPNSTTIAGSASVSFDSDPAFAVESPTTSKTAPVPGATTPVTGEPFLGESILAGLLVLGGTGGLAVSRRRRVTAAPGGANRELPARQEGLKRLAADYCGPPSRGQQ